MTRTFAALVLCSLCACTESPAGQGGPTVEPSPDPQPEIVEPEPEPEPAPELPREPERASELELTFVGDLVLGRYLEHKGREWFAELQPPEADPFAEVRPLLAADVVVGNLESPVRIEVPTDYTITKRLRFGASAAHMDQLQRGGFTVLSLANNHYFDLGLEGQLEGPSVVADAGMRPIGASRVEEPLLRIETLEVEGWRVGFLAFATLRNHSGEAGGPQLPFVSLAQLQTLVGPQLAEARETHDLLIVVVHWGTEYADEVRNSQRIAARRLLDQGVDLVIGHHPHVLQAIERHASGDAHDGLIAYSLGNFMFPRGDPRPGLTGVLRVVYSDRGEERRPCLEEARFHPAHIVKDPRWHPRPATGRRAEQIRRRLTQLSRPHATHWIADPAETASEDLVLDELRACSE